MLPSDAKCLNTNDTANRSKYYSLVDKCNFTKEKQYVTDYAPCRLVLTIDKDRTYNWQKQTSLYDEPD